MRFAELELLRYGHLEDCHLRFAGDQADLQIVFGANEAGKSTIMAAIGDLLFGFPHSTRYDFRFDKQLLRVGARLQADGVDVVCRRKKGRVGTLLDGQDRPLGEDGLKGMLAGYSSESFQRMFSLDHARLRQGGRAILEAQDDIGQAIFAAGSGLIGVAALLAGLEEEAREIWTRRAGDRRYHAAQRRYDEARARQKVTQIRPATWDDQRQQIARLDASLAALRLRRGGQEREREEVERRRRVLPQAALYRRVLAELAPLATVPELPADAGDVLDQVGIALATADAEVALAASERDQLQAALDALVVDARLIEHHDAIETLREIKGAVDKSLSDLPRRRADVATRSRRLIALQDELGWPGDAAAIIRERLPRRVQIAEIRGLLESRSALDATCAAAAADQAAARRILEHAQARLAELPAARDLDALSASLGVARGLGDLETAIRTAQREADRRAGALSTGLAQLAPWTGAAATLASVILPSDGETAAALDAAARAEAALAEALRDHQAELQRRGELELQRTQLARDAGAIPHEQLARVRTDRDTVWRAVRGHLLDDPLPDPAATATEFERRSALADGVADRRYSGAEQSGRITALQDELERSALLLSQSRQRLAEGQTATEAAALAWELVLAPSSLRLQPRAFIAWTDRYRRTLQAADEAERAEAVLLELLHQREDVRTRLAAALAAIGAAPASGQSFGLLLQAADRIEQAETEAVRRRRDLDAEVAAADEASRRSEAKRNVAREQIADWEDRWTRAVTTAGLDGGRSPAVIRAQLDLIEELRGEIHEILGLQQRIVTMEADIDAFGAEVARLAASCGYGLAASCGQGLDAASPGELLAALAGATREAAAARDRHAALADQLAAAKHRLAEAGMAHARALARLRPLSEAAGIEDRGELAVAVRRADRARTLRHELDRLTAEIVMAGAGPTLEVLLTQSEDDEAATLTLRIRVLQETQGGLSEEIARLTGERATVEAAAALLDDGPNAAIAASDAEQARSEMAVQAEAYVRKRAEVALLRWTIARYRAEKQTPLLRRASALFSRLTLGRYAALLVDLEGDKARLAGLDRGQAVVPVEGMSEGTVDQLFLALRLAAVEATVAAGARLPFLADDLFINYDDERARAGFQVLAELAQRTQVLFFTHHQHLVSVAEAALAPFVVSRCELAVTLQ